MCNMITKIYVLIFGNFNCAPFYSRDNLGKENNIMAFQICWMDCMSKYYLHFQIFPNSQMSIQIPIAALTVRSYSGCSEKFWKNNVIQYFSLIPKIFYQKYRHEPLKFGSYVPIQNKTIRIVQTKVKFPQ